MTSDYKSVSVCPVVSYDRAGEGYSDDVRSWIANPHAFFRSFGSEARAFQRKHRSERRRTMTLVAPASELVRFVPVCMSLDGSEARVASWQEVFAQVAARLIAGHPQTFAALQQDGELEWLGCGSDGLPVGIVLESGSLCPQFSSMDDVVARIQWLFLMCGIRLNEVVVQVDPFTDDEWRVRKAEIDRKRSENKRYRENRGDEGHEQT